MKLSTMTFAMCFLRRSRHTLAWVWGRRNSGLHEGGMGAMSAGMGGEMTPWGRGMLDPLRTALAKTRSGDAAAASPKRQADAPIIVADRRFEVGCSIEPARGRRPPAASAGPPSAISIFGLRGAGRDRRLDGRRG